MEETVGLLRKAQAGDKSARDQVVRENLGLIRHSIKRFVGRGYDSEDLYQIGCMGLLKAVDRFDETYDVCFSTYAVPMIQGEIRRFMRDDGLVKVNRTIKMNQFRIMKMREELTERLNRDPTITEIAEAADLPVEDVVIASNAAMEVESIYQTAYRSEDSEVMLIDQLAAEKDEQNETINRLLVGELLGSLAGKERKLILLRYYRNRTQTETALALGMTQVQVSRLEKRILQQLRAKVTEQ
ncbi:MAG: SigB/SigF/SigG family RNA polymerase sigma factor [Lachnospiraceae bacterium]